MGWLCWSGHGWPILCNISARSVSFVSVWTRGYPRLHPWAKLLELLEGGASGGMMDRPNIYRVLTMCPGAFSALCWHSFIYLPAYHHHEQKIHTGP